LHLVLMRFYSIAALLCACLLSVDVRVSRSLVSVQTLHEFVDCRNLVLARVLEDRVSDCGVEACDGSRNSRVLRDPFVPELEPATWWASSRGF
jgi:hypothetical protein